MKRPNQSSESEAPRKGALLQLLKGAKEIRWQLALACLLSIILVGCVLAIPTLTGNIVQQLIDGVPAGSSAPLTVLILPSLLLLGAAYAVRALVTYLKMLLLNKAVSRYFTCELRIRISDKIRRLPVSYVDQTPVGDILSRMMDDVSTMGNYIHQIVDTLMTGFLMIVAIAVMMLREDWRLALIVLALTPASIALSSFLSSKSEGHFYNMFTEGGNLNALVEESFTNFATTKAYNLERYTEEKHKVINDRRRKTEANANFISSIVLPIITFSNALAYIAICLVGGWLLMSGRVTSVGVVVTILLYAKQFSSPLEQIANAFGSLPHAKAAARRVFKILDMAEEEDPAAPLPHAAEGRVRFAHVDFSYDPAAPLIEDLNIDVKPGQNVAIGEAPSEEEACSTSLGMFSRTPTRERTISGTNR